MTSRVLAEHYDAVTVVGALGEGQVPISVLPELLRVTKPGKGGGGGSFPLSAGPPGRWDGTPGPGGCPHERGPGLVPAARDGRWHRGP